MLKIKDLWVGDKVVLETSQRIGKYIGKSADGRARIQIDGKIILAKEGSFAIMKEESGFPDHLLADFLEDKQSIGSVKQIKIKFEHTIDLHIDKLAPDMTNDFPGRIIEFQLAKCKEFVQEAIRLRYPHITIIHGKGQGILKNEVEALLKSFREARFQVSKNDGGALEVWLS